MPTRNRATASPPGRTGPACSDGQRTGRFDIETVEKTEKTYLGTKVEIVLRAAFDIPRGLALDFLIDGVEVDAKYSGRFGGWMLPREAVGGLCLLMHADDKTSTFSVGLIRVQASLLRAPNQDGKRSMRTDQLGHVCWLYRNAPLTENLLLHLSSQVRQGIFQHPGLRGGQRRVDELFRSVTGRIIRREVVLTVGKQDDPMKRVRDARTRLKQ